MTDNQFNQLFDLVTKCVNGVQRLEEGQKRLEGDVSELKRDVSELKRDVSELKSDVSELKHDVSELKTGQNRVEKQIRLNNAAINEFAGEQVRIRGIVTELEKASV